MEDDRLLISHWIPAPNEHPFHCLYCHATEERLGPYHVGPAFDVVTPGNINPERFTPYTCLHCMRQHVTQPDSPIVVEANQHVREMADLAVAQAREGLDELQAQVHALEARLEERTVVEVAPDVDALAAAIAAKMTTPEVEKPKPTPRKRAA